MQLEDSNTADISNDAPVDTRNTENNALDTSADTGIDPVSNLEAAADAIVDTSNDDLPTDKPASSKMKALLDEISGDTPPADLPAPVVDPVDPPAADAAPAAPAEPKTPEQEEAELLDGVKSERGKDRIRQVFSERKQLEADINEFKALITDTKMSPEEFAQTLEFGRLMNSGDEKDLRIAFEMVEQQRAILAQRLGVKAPGVDLLEGHEDLKQAVENMEITEDRALELARYRKQEAKKQEQIYAQQQTARNQEQFQQTIQHAAVQMEAYLNTRANEADSPIKLKAISEHFKNPANLQAFVTTYQPDQWVNTLKLMYDNVLVPKAPAIAQPQPLRSRPATLGSPSATGQTPIDRIASRLDSMGI